MAAPVAESSHQPVPVVPAKKANKILKKTKTKKVHRNLLAKPHDDYWPVLNPEENTRIKEVLQRIFDDENNLDNMKLVEKEQMALKRKKWSEYLVFGINDVPRCVVKGLVIAVLIADDVHPKHLVQHVATLCGAAAVPVLIVSSLRQHTKQLLGFSSITIGIKKIVAESEDNKLYEFHKLIDEISKNYKPPKSICQFNKVARKKDRSESEEAGPAVKTAVDTAEKPTASTDLYLYRTSRVSRVFVPESQKQEIEAPKVVRKQKLEDFVALGDSDWDFMETDTPVQGISYSMVNPKKKQKLEPSFVPLKYVKVKPNPNKKSH